VANITNEEANMDMVSDKSPMGYLHAHFLQPFQKMAFKPTNHSEIEETIRLVNPKLSSRYDGITVKLLKASAPYIPSPLTYICNKSLSTGIYSSHLKYSEITPIYKKGDKTN
jgi:hypothetical protein